MNPGVHLLYRVNQQILLIVDQCINVQDAETEESIGQFALVEQEGVELHEEALVLLPLLLPQSVHQFLLCHL